MRQRTGPARLVLLVLLVLVLRLCALLIFRGKNPMKKRVIFAGDFSVFPGIKRGTPGREKSEKNAPNFQGFWAGFCTSPYPLLNQASTSSYQLVRRWVWRR